MNRLSKLISCLAFALALAASANAQIMTPQGRLTLTSNTPVLTSDVVNATTVYYTPYVGNVVPLYNGSSAFINTSISQLTLTLNPSIQTTGHIYDVFVFANTMSVPTIAVLEDPWTNSHSRNTASQDQVSQVSGIWVTPCASSCTAVYNNGLTTYNNLKYPTYVGSIYMTGNGETSVQFNAPGTAGGTNSVVGLWNAYNRVRAISTESDSNSSWTDTGSSTWRAADSAAGTGNRISWLDGLQQMNITGRYVDLWAPGSSSAVGQIGVNLDSTTGGPFPVSAQTVTASVGNNTLNAAASFPPQLGFHYIQAMEAPSGATPTATFYGSTFMALTLETEY